MRGNDMDSPVKTQADLDKRILHSLNTDTSPVERTVSAAERMEDAS